MIRRLRALPRAIPSVGTPAPGATRPQPGSNKTHRAASPRGRPLAVDGTVKRTVVPPGPESIENVPPAMRTRSTVASSPRCSRMPAALPGPVEAVRSRIRRRRRRRTHTSGCPARAGCSSTRSGVRVLAHVCDQLAHGAIGQDLDLGRVAPHRHLDAASRDRTRRRPRRARSATAGPRPWASSSGGRSSKRHPADAVDRLGQRRARAGDALEGAASVSSRSMVAWHASMPTSAATITWIVSSCSSTAIRWRSASSARSIEPSSARRRFSLVSSARWACARRRGRSRRRGGSRARPTSSR